MPPTTASSGCVDEAGVQPARWGRRTDGCWPNLPLALRRRHPRPVPDLCRLCPPATLTRSARPPCRVSARVRPVCRDARLVVGPRPRHPESCCRARATWVWPGTLASGHLLRPRPMGLQPRPRRVPGAVHRGAGADSKVGAPDLSGQRHPGEPASAVGAHGQASDASAARVAVVARDDSCLRGVPCVRNTMSKKVISPPGGRVLSSKSTPRQKTVELTDARPYRTGLQGAGRGQPYGERD